MALISPVTSRRMGIYIHATKATCTLNGCSGISRVRRSPSCGTARTVGLNGLHSLSPANSTSPIARVTAISIKSTPSWKGTSMPLSIKMYNYCATCRGSRKGKVWNEAAILPDKICPLLYHSLYPYWLGLTKGVAWDWSEGTDLISCPASRGTIQVVVGRIPHPRKKYEIFGRVVTANECPRGHKEGDTFIFANTRRDSVLCPALWYHAFPFIRLPKYIKKCCSAANVRCPDWNGVVYGEVSEKRQR